MSSSFRRQHRRTFDRLIGFAFCVTPVLVAIPAMAEPPAAHTSVAPSSPAAPPKGEAAKSPAPKVELAVGYAVKDRELEPLDGDKPPFAAGDKLVAWTSLEGVSAGAVTHVWTRNGAELARQELSVGSAKRYRTWSRLTVRKPGTYDVKVLSTDGAELAKTSFDVE